MMKGALKRMGSAPKLRLPSSKSRSGTFDDGAAQPAGVTFQVSGALVGGVDLGGEPASAEQHIMLLEQQLREKTRRLEEAERQLIASTPSRQIQSEMKTVPPLPAGGTSSEALAWLRAACNRSAVTPEVFKMLLLALRENLAYDHLGLPRDDEDLFEYAARMHMLGDIDRDDQLSDKEFDRLWAWMQQGNARAHRVSEGGTEHGVLGQRFGSKFIAPVDKFVFGTRADWEGGLLEKLEHGALIQRSVEAECTSHGKELKDEYNYIVKQRAKHRSTPHGEYDLGHDGLTLKDFLQRAVKRGATLTLVEVAVLRMYTTLFYQPWNNALRRLDPSFRPDGGASLKEWATCIAVLFSAVMKLSGVAPRDADGNAIKRVWRGVDESERELPEPFLKPCQENGFYHPGGAEQAFSSTTTDPFTAHNFSGGWWVSGTILEIDFTAGSRGADVSFLSCYPEERELLLPPFCMFSTHGMVQRGPKRYIRCSIEFNPTKFDLDLEKISDVPKLRAIERVARARRNTDEAVHEAVVKMLQHSHPDFFDPFSQGQAMFVDPVVAEDGRTYERKYIELWIAQHAGNLISPTLRTPMGSSLTPNAELKHTIADALAKQHAEMKAVGVKSTTDSTSSHPVELKRVDELGEIFEQLDALGDILPASMESWQMPSFVVLGAESSGKSTLLERVSMFSMFPRADGICTRMAIKVELRRGAAKPAELQVVSSRTQEPITDPIIIMGELDVREEMEKTLRAEHSQLVGVSQTRMLVLRVSSPTVPSLDLVDLPGLVSVRRKGEPDDMAAQTEQLLSNFISDHKKHSVFLVVIPAAVPPNTAPVLRLVQEHKIEGQSIGIFTRSDGVADKDLRKIVKNRLIGEPKDGFPLRPYGWVASMNAPIEDDDGNVRDDLTPVQRLELQGQEEHLWLTQKLLSKQAQSDLSSRLGCNALIQKMKTAFHSYVKDTWAPFALFRLEGESARLSFEQATLGLPPAHTQLEGVLLEELQTEAIEAAERILNECIGDRVNAAYERATAADAAAATSKSSMRGLAALSEWAAKRHAELRRTSLEALKMAIVDVHDTLIADASSFKLGRFPMFVDAAVTELNDAIRRTVNHEDNLALVGGPSLRDLLKRAVASTAVSGWLERESCAAKRHRLDALAAGIAPAKTSITKLLNAQSPEDILIAANLNTRHLTSCRVDEVAFTGCTIAMEMHFELTVNEDAQLAGKLPWVGELRGPDGNGVPVHFHNVSPGKYAGTFTPTLKAFPLALCCDLRCSLTIRLHEVVVPQSSIPVLVKMLTTTSQKCAAWKKAGVSIDSLVAAGLRVDELKSCGYSALELKGVGFSATELGEAGFSAAELARAGFEAIKMGKYAEEARLEVGQSVLVSGFGHATIVKLGRKVKVEYDDGSTYHVLCSQLSRLEVGQSVLVNGFGHATIVKLGRKVKVEYDDGSTYHVLRSQLSLDDSGEIDESSSDDLLDWE